MPRELAALEKPLDTNEFVSARRMAVANAVRRRGVAGRAWAPSASPSSPSLVLSDGEWPYESDVTSASHEPEARRQASAHGPHGTQHNRAPGGRHMHDFEIVTDSTCDLPPETISRGWA
jgi:hypothetical protein